MNIDRIIHLLRSGDKHACNKCQTVLKELEKRNKFWLVVDGQDRAVVVAPNETLAMTTAGLLSAEHVYELDPDNLNFPNPRNDRPFFILSNV